MGTEYKRDEQQAFLKKFLNARLAGLSVEASAERVGISSSTVYAWVKGRIWPKAVLNVEPGATLSKTTLASWTKGGGWGKGGGRSKGHG
jgi:transposase